MVTGLSASHCFRAGISATLFAILFNILQSFADSSTFTWRQKLKKNKSIAVENIASQCHLIYDLTIIILNIITVNRTRENKSKTTQENENENLVTN